MQLKPNKTILEGSVTRVVPAGDGWGANIEFTVAQSRAAKGFQDFLGAEPGATLTIFAAEPQIVEAGKKYVLTTSCRGGPGGERVILENARPVI